MTVYDSQVNLFKHFSSYNLLYRLILLLLLLSSTIGLYSAFVVVVVIECTCRFRFALLDYCLDKNKNAIFALDESKNAPREWFLIRASHEKPIHPHVCMSVSEKTF